MATTSSGLPKEPLKRSKEVLAGQQDLITQMIREWIDANCTEDLPLKLTKLAKCAGSRVHQHLVSLETPTCPTSGGQWDKGGIPPRTDVGPV